MMIAVIQSRATKFSMGLDYMVNNYGVQDFIKPVKPPWPVLRFDNIDDYGF